MGLVLLDFVVEQLGVGQRMVDHERPAKARAKGHLRLGAKADSGASDLAGVAGNEMVDGLVGREFGDGRHNPGRVASEENDVFGMTGAFFGQMIFDVRERMGRTGVFGDGVIIEVEVAGDGIEGDVFEDGAKTAGPGVDVARRRRKDESPWRLADKLALGIGGKSGFAGAGKAEENGHVAGRANVSRSSAWKARLAAGEDNSER